MTKNESTRETCPCHIWMHEVELATLGLIAARTQSLGAFAKEVFQTPEFRAIMLRAYRNGEPVWMAAEDCAFRAIERARAHRADPGAELRSARRACERVIRARGDRT